MSYISTTVCQTCPAFHNGMLLVLHLVNITWRLISERITKVLLYLRKTSQEIICSSLIKQVKSWWFSTTSLSKKRPAIHQPSVHHIHAAFLKFKQLSASPHIGTPGAQNVNAEMLSVCNIIPAAPGGTPYMNLNETDRDPMQCERGVENLRNGKSLMESKNWMNRQNYIISFWKKMQVL